MSKEKQNIKLEKVDDKTAYENLLVKYAELENKIADIKANCDLAIEGRDVKIMELEKENAELKKKIGIYQKGMYDEIEKRDRKLTKAKEIIKNLLILKKDHYGNTDIEWRVEVTEQAEQFLVAEPMNEEKDAWQKYYDFGR